MSGHRNRRTIPADHFLVLPEVIGVHAALSAEGFAAQPTVAPQVRGGRMHVSLIWRRGTVGEHCVLRLRLRLARVCAGD